MSASSKKKLRAEENAAKLTEKQLSEKKEAKKVHVYTILFCAVMAVMIVAAVWIGISQSITNSGAREKKTIALTVGNHEINNVEMNYFFVDSVNQFYSQYGSYASIFGLDPTKPLNEQVTDEETGKTWADDFLASAQSSAQEAYAVVDAANAAGYTLPQETQDQINTYLTNLDSYAKIYGFSNTDAYLKALYGNGATKESYAAYYTMNALAGSYEDDYRSNLSFTEDEISAKDAEDPTVYNNYSYHLYYLAASKFLTGGTTDADGKTTYTDAENAAAQAAAEEAVATLVSDEITSVEDMDAAIAALSVNADTTAASSAYTDVASSSVLSAAADWIKDSARKAGDKTYVASTSTSTAEDGTETTTVNGYYAIFFEGVNDNRFPLANVRHILVRYQGGTTDSNGSTTYSDEEKAAAMTSAQEILGQWKSGEATEESFATLASEKSTDTGSVNNGGLYENVYPGQMVTAFNDWCFDSSRKPGDTGIVETEYGCHVMYYSGDSDITYRNYKITEDLRSSAYSQWRSDILAGVSMTEGDSKYIRSSMVLSSGNS